MTIDELNENLKGLGIIKFQVLNKPLYYRIDIDECQAFEMLEIKIGDKVKFRVVEIGERNSASNDVVYDYLNDACDDYLSRIKK